MKKIIILLISVLFSLVQYGQVIADHTKVDKFQDIPQQYIDEVKKMWLVVAGESHSAGYRAGLEVLETLYPAYAVSVKESGTPEAYTTSHLRASRATWGDIDHSSGWIYSYGEEDWCCFYDYPTYTYNPAAVARTKAGITYSNTHSLNISAIGFGHCYDDGENLYQSYLRATQEYVDYCSTNGYSTKVFFTTGPIDDYMSSGAAGYEQYLKWEHIRDYIGAHPSSIFFDYADILSYNDDGQQETASWDGHTYPVIHPDNLEGDYTGGHIGTVGALRLAKATWWMLARIAGWDGGTVPTVPVAGIVVSGATTISTDKGTLQLSATITPSNATNKTVTWSIQNGTGQASINSTGLITAISNGTVTARATANDGSGVYGTLTITISNQVIPIASITITSPNGGENWQVGSIHTITWTASGTSGTVRIEYSTNNGSSWTNVIASTPDDGSQSWTIPNAPSTNCIVRVSDSDGSPTDISNSVFTISSVTSVGCINETFTASSGTVTDNSGSSDYLNNMSCDKLIQPLDGGPITLRFTEFHTEVTYDVVRVYDGSTTSSPLLGSFSGNSLPPTLISSAGSMLIRFTSDWGDVAAGWSATYTTLVPPTSITITSPNGGENWQVGSIHNITWTASGTSGTVRIEYSTNNGSSWTNVIASTPDDGSQSWTIPNAPSTNCIVRVSDSDGSPIDISNSVFTISSVTSVGCINETFTASSGTITDNSGASDYLNNMSCDKLIQPLDGGPITLRFTEFHTEVTYDVVRVYDGSTTSSPLLGSFSGNSLPPTLISSAGSMLIRFTSDWGDVAAGWSATYTTLVPPTSITITSPNGGENWQVGSIHTITWTASGTSGTVRIEYSTNNGSSWTNVIASTPDDGSQSWTIPNAPSTNCIVRVSDSDGSPTDISNSVFTISSVTSVGCINETFTASSGTVTDNSGSSDYLNNMSCDKLIQPLDGGPITLRFTEFHTEVTYDVVRVYDGSTTSSPLLGSFSGNSLPPTLISSAGSMLIRFTSDWGDVAAGWSATYTTLVPPTSITITSPNGGENWQVGSIHNITWTASGTSGTVRIEYSTNNGSSWTNVIASTPDDGSQSWTIPNAPSTNCIVRVSDSDGSPTDISNSVFTISSGTSVGCINETFTASSGTVTDNSGTSDYLNNMSCDKLIQPLDGGTITLRFTEFHTEVAYDVVRVYDGSTTSSPLLGSFSGNSLPHTLISSAGSMLIRFTSDWGDVAAGWSATYTTQLNELVKGTEQISRQETLPEIVLQANPIPTTGFLTIKSNSFEEESYTVDLINISGQIILNQQINIIGGKYEIDMSDIINGYYLLRIMNNKTVQFIRVIKQ